MQTPAPIPPHAGSGTFADAVADAAAALRPLFEPTPLQRNALLSDRYGADIWLKREDLTPVRSYKLRGALTAMRKALALRPGARFVCASAGNHAQGMAYACREFGAQGTIFMPVTTPQQKIQKTRMFGGDSVHIELFGDYFDQSLRAAQAMAQDSGSVFLSPFDNAEVIAGQATVGHEVLDQGPPPDLVVLPVGGGGLAAGMARLLSERAPATRFALVEPAGGASLHAALAAGQPVTLPTVDNFVDGAAVARIGDLPFATLSRFAAADLVLAPEDRVCATMLEMLNVEGIVLEPAGALAIDALAELAARGQLSGRQVVCVCSGGNFDFQRLPEVRERAQRHAGVKKYFILRLPQRPGALREFLNLLGPDDDIARFEYLKKSARNFGSVLIGIETTHPANLAALNDRLRQAGLDWRDITGDVVLSEFLI